MGPKEGTMKETSGSESISTRLQRVAELARLAPNAVLTTLAHHIDMEFLNEAYRRTRKDGAPGIDGQTAAEYAVNLESNLRELLSKFKAGTYKAPPVRRAYIPKGSGSELRALGMPTFEDKILQRAVTMILEAVYEQDFFDFSFAYRPGRTQHEALEGLWRAAMQMGGGWLLEVDIKDCFGSFEHKHLRACLDKRVKDGVIRKAIDKWLKAGIWEEGRVEHAETGTPQGGVVSPLLANIYLHDVMDEWFDKEVKPRMQGATFIVRWADDIIILFEKEEDARKVLHVLPKRFAKHGLETHPMKTRLTKFKRPDKPDEQSEGKFDFLGFTHFWAKSKKGNWFVQRKTSSKKLSSSLRNIGTWCRENRHIPMRDQHKTLCRKLSGHYQYFGITGNSRSLERFEYHVKRIWKKWLNRRSQRKSYTWERFMHVLSVLPLPTPRIHHSYLKAKPTS